jgi:phosphatidylserine/phosphatidylglycerophosphate/cardiolipin synthase-like enzyme
VNWSIQPKAGGGSLLRPGQNCWRIESASRVAFLVDNADFFAAAKSAMMKAHRSILLVGWEFDPRRRLDTETNDDQLDQIGKLLIGLADERPDITVCVLIWNAALGIALGKRMMPQRAHLWFRKTRVRFHLDGTVPRGATHHQKLLVIDDEVAFCSGDDFSANRWDHSAHRDVEPCRHTPRGAAYPPRHGMTVIVDGPAARALGTLARERWQRATGESLPIDRARPPLDPWPNHVPSDVQDARVGICRTVPRWRNQREIRENEALYLDGIRAARRLLYFENQYFASPVIGDALAERLSAADGLEVVVITGEHAPSFFDRATMDPPRDALIRRLRAADPHGRFQLYAPYTSGGQPVLVHSKVMIVDDRLVRIGSTNLADRSFGYDTECDLAIELAKPSSSAVAKQLCHRLVGHFLGVESAQVERAITRSGGLIAAIEDLDRLRARRLRPLHPPEPSFPSSFISQYHLGDPPSPEAAWRPWRRRRGA